MFIKKAKIANECATYVNKLEVTLASQPNFPDGSLIHFLGQRDAFMKIYDFITKTNVKSDEIPIEDILTFVTVEAKKSSSIAYNTYLDVESLNNKRLALGQVMSYKTVQQILLTYKSEQNTEDSD